jgi:hypothetical protein
MNIHLVRTAVEILESKLPSIFNRYKKFVLLQQINENFFSYFKLVVGISESSNSRVSNQNSRSRLKSLDSRNFQNLVLEI